MFAGVGERTREGNDFYHEMKESNVLDKVALVYGQMNEPPGNRLRVALTGLTMAEYFRDEGRDVLMFIDNIYRYTLAGVEVSALLGRMPSAVGYQPTLAEEMGVLQERITSTSKGSITSIQAVYVPADDLTDPSRPPRLLTWMPRLCWRAPLPSWVFTRPWIRLIPPRVSLTRRLSVRSITTLPRTSSRCCSVIKSCRTSSLSWVWTSFPKKTSSPSPGRVKFSGFLSQPFFVAEVFTGSPGKYVSLKDTIRGFRAIVDGEHDDLPEQAFYMVGSIDEAVEKARNL